MNFSLELQQLRQGGEYFQAILYYFVFILCYKRVIQLCTLNVFSLIPSILYVFEDVNKEIIVGKLNEIFSWY